MIRSSGLAEGSQVLFHRLLDEKQRWLCAGLESLKLRHGGDVKVAEFFGIGPHTVANGPQHLPAEDFSCSS